MDLEQLGQHLPKTLTPQRDLWPGIAQRIAPAAVPTRRPAPWPLAACLLLGFLLGTLFPPQSWQTPASPSWDTEQVLAMLERQHQRRQDQLSHRLPRLHSASHRDIEVLRGGSQELLQAIRMQPDNLALLELLLWTQQRELELMTQPITHPTLGYQAL
ncbi:hypothetical protein [Ferrimonas pelagia]|uniref:Uncharacterized protein n=1 Tax=Ferrimonas pelagia TaxID=1177826 RepID=A0ABP9FBI6_9GAMM